jgi:hypothetical protein
MSMSEHIKRSASAVPPALVLLSLLATPALAQEARDKSLPVLGGHNFLISAEVADPFITSFIRNNVGAGVAFDVNNVLTDTAGDTVLNQQGNIAFLNLGFEYQGALADWVAIRLGFEGAARVGTSAASLLGNGVSAVYGYFLGGTFRLFETEKVILSATADFTGNKIYDVGILRIVQDAIDQGDIPDSSEVVESGTDKTGLGGLRFAWAASRLIGVRLTGSIGVADLFQQSQETKFSFFTGAAVGFNFHNTSNVPIGLLAFFNGSNFSPGASNVADEVYTGGLEIDYTGYEDLGLGLTLAWSRIPLANSEQEISTFSAVVNLRFFF